MSILWAPTDWKPKPAEHSRRSRTPHVTKTWFLWHRHAFCITAVDHMDCHSACSTGFFRVPYESGNPLVKKKHMPCQPSSSTVEVNIPSGNQTWQWKIPCKWRFIAGKNIAMFLYPTKNTAPITDPPPFFILFRRRSAEVPVQIAAWTR